MVEIFTLFAGIILAQISPGPNMLAVAAAALGAGRAAGVATALGIAAGVIIWSLVFALGVGAVLKTFPQALVAMRFVGGGYLLYIGLRALYGAIFVKAAPQRVTTTATAPLPASFLRGLLVVLTNPKAAMMWVAIAMFMSASSPGVVGFLMIGLGASLSAAVIYGGYAILFSTGVAVRTYQRFFRVIESLFGALFAALGGKLVLDGIRELR